MALIYFGSRSRVKASMISTGANRYCIHDYTRLRLDINLRPILMVRMGPASYCT